SRTRAARHRGLVASAWAAAVLGLVELLMDRLQAERIAEQLQFPPDFFDPPVPRPDEWPDNTELRRAVDWFKSFISPQQWIQRREQAARRLYLSAMGIGSGDGRFFDA